jgi:hypothetical protein
VVSPGNISDLICLSDGDPYCFRENFTWLSVVVSWPMLCAERHVLLSDYQETARVYADSVRKMTDLVGLGIDSEVALLRRVCRTSWEAAERARMALLRHEANHGCDRADFVGQAIAGSSVRP